MCLTPQLLGVEGLEVRAGKEWAQPVLLWGPRTPGWWEQPGWAL